MPFLGEISALITSLSFSFTSSFFTLAGRRVGSVVVNRTRLVLAVALLSLTHLIFLRSALPLDAAPERWLWLSLSGVVGLALGDAFLFQAFVLIGPRISMLMMSLAPILAAVLAWLFLGETLANGQLAGILITLAGVGWVVMEGNNQQNGNQGKIDPPSNREKPEQRAYLAGLLFGLGGATGQALGLILAKKGLGGNFPAISGNLIRMLAAASVIWAVTLLQGKASATLRQLSTNRKAIRFIVVGTIFGPFIGVSFSLLSIQHTAIGIASTLMALPPVFLIPISLVVFKERIGWQAIAGTLVAFAGVALLFLV